VSEEVLQATGDLEFWKARAEAAVARAHDLANQMAAEQLRWMVAEADNAALRACLADTLGFAWTSYRYDNPKYVVDVRQHANNLIAADHPGAALLQVAQAAAAYVGEPGMSDRLGTVYAALEQAVENWKEGKWCNTGQNADGRP